MRKIMLALLLTTATVTAHAETGTLRQEVGNRVSENLPAIPPELVESLSQYQNTRGATFLGWLRDGSLLISTRFGDTSQVHRVSRPLGMREQLTFHREPVRGTVGPAG
jgi:hypothetical protein